MLAFSMEYAQKKSVLPFFLTQISCQGHTQLHLGSIAKEFPDYLFQQNTNKCLRIMNLTIRPHSHAL